MYNLYWQNRWYTHWYGQTAPCNGRHFTSLYKLSAEKATWTYTTNNTSHNMNKFSARTRKWKCKHGSTVSQKAIITVSVVCHESMCLRWLLVLKRVGGRGSSPKISEVLPWTLRAKACIDAAIRAGSLSTASVSCRQTQTQTNSFLLVKWLNRCSNNYSATQCPIDTDVQWLCARLCTWLLKGVLYSQTSYTKGNFIPTWQYLQLDQWIFQRLTTLHPICWSYFIRRWHYC